MRFKFFRIYVLAVCKHDNVFAAPGDGQITIRIDEAEIACTEPTIFNRLRGLFRRMVVALHENRPADPYFTDSHLVWSIDADSDASQWFSDCADAIAVHRCRRRGGGCFRQSVSLKDRVSQV